MRFLPAPRGALLPVLVLAVLSGTADSQTQPLRPADGGALAERFQQLDRNGDGKVSAEEFPSPLFKQMDKDGDGFVTMEEGRAFYAGRRTTRSAAEQPAQPASTPSAPLAGGELKVVDAVFELWVRDVAACAKFYRDGIGMREVEPADAQNGALLEWVGCYLRLRFSGIKDAELIGARVLLYEEGQGKSPDARLLGMRVIAANHSYKSGCALEVHFGLGQHDRVDVKVTLLDGSVAKLASVAADCYLDVNLRTHAVEPVSAGN